jgi:hypothetical protein
MEQILGDRVTRVWEYGVERYKGNMKVVMNHMKDWVIAATARPGKNEHDRKIVELELIRDGDKVVGVMYRE